VFQLTDRQAGTGSRPSRQSARQPGHRPAQFGCSTAPYKMSQPAEPAGSSAPCQRTRPAAGRKGSGKTWESAGALDQDQRVDPIVVFSSRARKQLADGREVDAGLQ